MQEVVDEGDLVVVMRLRVADPTTVLKEERDSLKSEQIDMLWQAQAEEMQGRYESICGNLSALSFRIESWSEYHEEEETKLFYELVAETSTRMLANTDWCEEFAWRIFSAQVPYFVHASIPQVFDLRMRTEDEDDEAPQPKSRQPALQRA